MLLHIIPRQLLLKQWNISFYCILCYIFCLIFTPVFVHFTNRWHTSNNAMDKINANMHDLQSVFLLLLQC